MESPYDPGGGPDEKPSGGSSSLQAHRRHDGPALSLRPADGGWRIEGGGNLRVLKASKSEEQNIAEVNGPPAVIAGPRLEGQHVSLLWQGGGTALRGTFPWRRSAVAPAVTAGWLARGLEDYLGAGNGDHLSR
jgi:hypothetical protein